MALTNRLRAATGANHSRPAYRSRVLGRLQDTRGEPRLRIRILAALVIFGLLLISAPLLMVPLVDWLMHQL